MKTESLKLAVIYDPKCPKLMPDAYSSTYADMLYAVVDRFATVQAITQSCSAEDIEADVILIYDIHSSHKIAIDGLEGHKAVKYTYFDDPHQQDFTGTYQGGKKVHKLGPGPRTERAMNRGVNHIICPYKNSYYEHIAPFLAGLGEKILFWFPPAPSIKRFPKSLTTIPLSERKHKILGNGFINAGAIYDFRRWAFQQPNTYYVKHAAQRPDVPKGLEYVKLLAQFTGALALCDWHIVPKYLEIPLAGCVCFAQDQQDYRDMGFKDLMNCVYIGDLKNPGTIDDLKGDFATLTGAFLNCHNLQLSMDDYQEIATNGRKLIEDNWTAEHFAEAFYNHALERVRTPIRIDF